MERMSRRIRHTWPAATLCLGMALLPLHAKADIAMGAIQLIGNVGGTLFMEHREKVKEGEAMNLKSGLMGHEKCLEPVGTLRIHEPEQGGWSDYGLTAPTRVLQAIVNESSCFKVVDRSLGFEVAQQERALAMTGQLANGQSLANAQMLGADYVLIPAIIGQNAKAGGSSLSASNLLGGIGLKSRKKTAEVVLTLMDVRTSEQIISVTGEAKISDIDLSANATDGAGTSASAGSWSNTDIGKVIKTAYEKSYKNMIREVGEKNLLARYQPQDVTANIQATANQLVQQGMVQAQQLAANAVHATAAVSTAANAVAQPALAAHTAATALNNQLVNTAQQVANHPAPNAAANVLPAADALLKAESLEVRRRARLFAQASLQAQVLAEMHEGMLVYPQGETENGMLKVEDELGNIGWLPAANLKLSN